jgi:hypothetical protein
MSPATWSMSRRGAASVSCAAFWTLRARMRSEFGGAAARLSGAMAWSCDPAASLAPFSPLATPALPPPALPPLSSLPPLSAPIATIGTRIAKIATTGATCRSHRHSRRRFGRAGKPAATRRSSWVAQAGAGWGASSRSSSARSASSACSGAT